jgi:Ca-activated chloride channel family protein
MPRTLSPANPEHGLALRTANPHDKIALRGVRLLARLAGMSQRVTVEQTFVNLEPKPIEAVYTFPLPESAAVCGFEVVTADRLLTGTVEEAEQATEQYEAAVSEGHGAFLMEQDRPDVFTVRVGNLKPRQAATIRLTYVCPLERVDKQIRVAFPTTVAPRYATATATDPIEAAVDGDALNPPHVLSVPYGLTMRVEVDLGRDLVGCFSPSHAIDVSRDGSSHDAAGKAVVTLAAGVAEMNRDVVLSLRLAKEQQPLVQSAPGPDGATYLAVTFVPEFDEAELGEQQPTETVFVLDCSGSMMGESIEQAKAALELCLRSLSPGDTFNVCRFGSSFELLASEPLPYTQQTLDRGLAYVRQSRDLGGTELHPPLEAILRVPPPRGVVRQVILLTDGQVTNEPAVIELCRAHRKANRVFSFGIGSGCSAFLVKGVARATGGAAEFITAGERIDEKVLRTFARLASPVVSDVAIDWDGAEVQTLAEIPPVFDGDVLAVFGRVGGATLPRHVTLSCQVGGGNRSWRVEVPPPAADDNVVATMWARRTIQSLEEVNGAVVRARKQKPTREQETLVRISKQFNLLCGLTTFVAVEHRSEADRTTGQPAVRRVPVVIAKDWGGVDMAPPAAFGGRMAAPVMAAPMAAPAAAMPMHRSRVASTAAKKRSGGLLGKLFGGGAAGAGGRGGVRSASAAPGGSYADSAAAPPVPPSAAEAGGTGLYELGAGAPHESDDDMPLGLAASLMPDMDAAPAAGGAAVPGQAFEFKTAGRRVRSLQDLLSLQGFDGAFGGDPDDLASLLADHGGTAWPAEVRQSLPATVAATDRPAVEHTVVALLLLASAYADQAALWQRAAKKATKLFLARTLGKTSQEAEAWVDALRQRLVGAGGGSRA